LLFLIALFLLAPRYWEPGGESWGTWASARVLSESGEYPPLSKGPVYVLYLLLFQWIDYPLSIRLEHIATHLFCYAAIYWMLRSVLPRLYAFLLTCVWIPLLAVTEGGGAIAGMGFLALYLRGGKCGGLATGYFPPLLGLAGLCHNVYLPFLLGHTIGMLIEKVRRKQPFSGFFPLVGREKRLPLAVNTALLILLLFSAAFPVQHPRFNNHMMIDAAYAPEPLADNMTTSFFHLGTYKWMMRNVPPAERIYHDWYLNQEKAFGDSQNILEAMVKKPRTVIENFVENLHGVNRLPIFFLTGDTTTITLLSVNFFLLIFMLASLAGLFLHLWRLHLLSVVCSIAFGTLAVIGALLLTSFNHRYIMTLLPVGLLVVAHMDKGFQLANEKTLSALVSRHHRMLGALFVIAGILTNERFLPDVIVRKLTPSYLAEFWLLNILFAGLGGLLIFRKQLVLQLLARDFWSRKSRGARNVVILVSSVCVLGSASYPCGWSEQMRAVFNGEPLLSEAKDASPSMVASRKELFRSVNRRTRVLAYEHTWLLAYADVDLNNVYQMHSLPPFEDPSGKTGRFLDSMDVIWVSSNFSAAAHTFGFSKYLRYRYHVQPFLEQALKRGWTVEHVKHFGSIYRRPIPSSVH